MQPYASSNLFSLGLKVKLSFRTDFLMLAFVLKITREIHFKQLL